MIKEYLKKQPIIAGHGKQREIRIPQDVFSFENVCLRILQINLFPPLEISTIDDILPLPCHRSKPKELKLLIIYICL